MNNLDEIKMILSSMQMQLEVLSDEVSALRSEVYRQKSAAWMDMKEACAFLHLSPSTMKNRMSDGDFPWAVKKGRKWMFPVEKLKKYIGNTV